MVELEALTVGHSVDTSRAGVGLVHSVFARAVNLEIRGQFWSLLAADRADLPFGIRVRSSTFEHLSLHRADRAFVRAGFLGIGSRVVIDCRAAPRWTPVFACHSAAGLPERIDSIAKLAREHAWPESELMADTVLNGLRNRKTLGRVLASVVGRGPGSTPAGDDVLIGVLVVLKSPCSGLSGARAAESLCRELPGWLPATTEISGHLLRQAASGLFSRDVHELLRALVAGAPSTDLENIARRVIATGATSGADLCTGLCACARAWVATFAGKAAA